jgi:hypothetical protein
MPEGADQSKVCKDCGVRKPFGEFWVWKTSADGRALYCKACFKVRNAASADRRAARDGRTRRPRPVPPTDVPDGHRFCPSCLSVLPQDDFVRNRSTTSGYGTYCRPCQNAKSGESLARRHGSGRHDHLKHRYGIGAAEVEQQLHGQDWRCLVCTNALTLATAHVDHDHATGAVRGLLCFNCNGGLGQFHDDADRLRRAAEYVETHKPLIYGFPAGDRIVVLAGRHGRVTPSPAEREMSLLLSGKA